MFNIVFSEEYTVAPKLLAQMRTEAGLSQRDLAAALGRSQGHVHRMETCQRSIELVEFCRIARATRNDPAKALAHLLAEWGRLGCSYGELGGGPDSDQRPDLAAIAHLAAAE
jgi:transcriptional regulator with XRE-family HTH domain